MSVTSKIVFGSCCLASLGTIVYVHYKQQLDRWVLRPSWLEKFSKIVQISKICRSKLKEGIYRDIERQQVRHEMNKTMNTYNLQQQKELEKILRREENVNFASKTWEPGK